MLDVHVESCLRGDALYGDDFGPDEIAQWYSEEANAYTDLVDASVLEEFEYAQWANRYGFRPLRSVDNLGHVVGFGSGYGHELKPLDARAERFTIIESSSAYTAAGCGLQKPVTFLESQPSGRIELADASVDLIVCFGVLHHVPNVSFVVSEFRRVMRPGGYLVVREPIVSMGDWRSPRRGLTKNERGIPLRLLWQTLARSRFEVESSKMLGFPVIPRVAARVGSASPYNKAVWTVSDRALCALSSWNYSYHATSFLRRLRPTSAAVIARAIES